MFSSSQRAYIATERRAPSVPVPETLQIAAPTDSVSTAGSQRLPLPARRPAKKLRPLGAKHSGSLPAWARPLATKVVAKRLAKLVAAPQSPRPTARYEGTASSSGTLVAALCLLGAGLLGLLIGASISTNIAGAIFGVFFIVLGSLAIAVGLVMLIIALLAR